MNIKASSYQENTKEIQKKCKGNTAENTKKYKKNYDRTAQEYIEEGFLQIKYKGDTSGNTKENTKKYKRKKEQRI